MDAYLKEARDFRQTLRWELLDVTSILTLPFADGRLMKDDLPVRGYVDDPTWQLLYDRCDRH